MYRIFEFMLNILKIDENNNVCVDMPDGAQPLSVDANSDGLVCWALCNDAIEDRSPVWFKAIVTGAYIAPNSLNGYKFMNTVHMHGGHTYHVFVKEDNTPRGRKVIPMRPQKKEVVELKELAAREE